MPRITGGSLDEHREQIRQSVFEALTALLEERSFDAITMAQLAAKAGMGRTAIYHHFPDKEAVVVAFASHETEQYLSRLEEVLATADSPVERIRIYVDYHLAAGEQFHMGLGMQFYGLLSQESRLAIREHVLEVERVLRELLDAGIDSGDFIVDDVAATMSLIHACLSPRHLAPATIEAFVLRALGVH
ncbi:TetR/AcrR family transcriptional regulator [Nocardioides daejeonensis]|uniref:TetR/AcrR family transcriptional regulator n=1 Tax=Nocardioides daejeonensis TaxID=1046556 RepID=UPI000D748BAB|nr:TetR/AcrR family transcriptional regulator [Nocardioides daejeonensis]